MTIDTLVKLIETGSGDWINWLLTIVDNKKMVSSTVISSLFSLNISKAVIEELLICVCNRVRDDIINYISAILLTIQY